MLTNVTVTDPLSPNCNRTSAQIPALASMAPSASVTYSCSRPNVRRAFDNVATATGTPPSGPNVTASDTAPVKVKKALTPPKKKKHPQGRLAQEAEGDRLDPRARLRYAAGVWLSFWKCGYSEYEGTVNRSIFSFRISFPAALAAVAATLLLLVPAARSDTSTVIWTTPTPKDQARFTVDHGKRVTLKLAAATSDGAGIVRIAPAQKFPTGVSFNSSDGLTASASFNWTPEAAGDYKLSSPRRSSAPRDPPRRRSRTSST